MIKVMKRDLDMKGGLSVDKVVKVELLHLQAYNIIKQSILDGKRKPSERVVETQVASSLGISRGPVREAIRMLIQDGLLIYNDGFVKVYEPTVKDVIEIFECRESLENLAIELTIKKSPEEFFKTLEKNLTETEEVVDRDIDLIQLDQEFHTIIVEASGNSHLLELLDTIKIKSHYMRSSLIGAEFYPKLLNEHKEIYEAILNKDEKKAKELMSIHIQRGLAGVLEKIK